MITRRKSMKLIYEGDIEGDYSEIEEIHNMLDSILLKNRYDIKKSVLKSEGEAPEITIHDSEQKCRVCGCDWFHACLGGCYWVEDDLCSSCEEDLANEMLSNEENGCCAECKFSEDVECATVFVCKLTGEKHYAGDTCYEFAAMQL